MPLGPGVRLGPYEIQSAIGAGGMGEVYRARDTRLKRDVALKILPESFASDSDRLARFQREAEVLASLNHPNIAQIYGIEDSNGVRALVMELVEGETLAERIARGPIPPDDALPIAKQIAEALEAAHERGIIHRDLKPANITLTPNATVKVLDFGLAKALEPVGQTGSDVTLSPTITSPAMITGVGMLLGTAAYMAPEQAKGKPADARSDIWAFGAVLYEMLTGQRAFEGEDVSDTLASVLRSEPDWQALPPHSRFWQRALRRCLEKDRRRRFAHIADVLLDLEDSPTRAERPTPEKPQRAISVPTLVTSIIVAVVVSAAVMMRFSLRPSPSTSRVVRLQTVLPEEQTLVTGMPEDDVAISPDGTRLVYVAEVGGVSQLYMRDLERDVSVPMKGTEGARGPFFSPDGKWVAFGLRGMKKAPVDGGPIAPICSGCFGGSRGASWKTRDEIIFSDGNGVAGIKRVAPSGGDPVAIAGPDRRADEVAYLWPDVIPGGRNVLFTIEHQNGLRSIASRDLGTGVQKVLIREGNHPRYAAGDYIVYEASGGFWAAKFDPAKQTISGPSVALPEQVVTKPTGAAVFSISETGTLLYLSGVLPSEERQLLWLDRDGREEVFPAPTRAYQYPRISPDGQRVALQIQDQQNDIWIWTIAQRTLTRFTFDDASDQYPAWTPDGRRIAFSSSGSLFWRSSDGSGAIERLANSRGTDLEPYGFTANGSRLLVRENGLSLVEMPRGTLHSLLPKSINGEISPNGRWLAYESTESARREIVVRPFPDVDHGRWQISQTGGVSPLWDRSGRELFYLTLDNALMRVLVQDNGFPSFGTPEVLIRKVEVPAGSVGRTYDVTPNGQRFLFVRDVPENQRSSNSAQLNVVLNWTDELRRRASPSQ